MAVEIPVVIDIDKAFEDAAKQVPQGVKILERGLSDNAMAIEIKLDAKGATATVKEFVDGSITDISKFNKAITQISNEMKGLVLAGQVGTERWQALDEALVALKNIKKEVNEQVNATSKAMAITDRQNAKLKEQEAAYLAIKDTIAGVQLKVSEIREELETTKFDDASFEKLAIASRKAADELKAANEMVAEMGMKKGSIEQLSLTMSQLADRWESMGEKEMFDANGNLTKTAQAIQNEYTKISSKLEKQRSLLNEQIDKQREAAQEAQRRAREEERLLAQMIAEEDAQRKHNEILTQSSKTIDQLNAQIAAWNEELNKSEFGSAAFTNAAIQARVLSERMAEVAAQAKIIGANVGSIDQISAKLSELSRQYNALSAGMREGQEGKAILAKYRDELEKLGKSAQQVIQEEQRAAENAKRQQADINKRISARKTENLILATTAKNMRTLQEQERILSERLARAKFGSDKYAQLREQLEKVRAKMKEVTGATKETNDELNKQSGIIPRLVSSLGAYVSIHSLWRFAKQIRDVTAELEYQRVALGHLIQDEAYGAELFEKIKAAAVESPFRIKELVTYTKQLAAYRIETTELFSTTKMLADVSAGLGVDMNRLILAFGQVRAASVLRGQELRQFTEAGIPLVELLAEKFTDLNGRIVTTGEVFKLISERAVPFSMVADIFRDMTEEGGQFYEMQEIQAKTLQGRWEKLKDTFDIALQEIGDTKTFRGEMELLLNTLNFLARNLRVVPKLMAAATVAALGYAAAAARLRAVQQASVATNVSLSAAELRNIAAMNLGKTAARVYARAQLGLKASTNGLSRAFWKLTAAMAANPIIAIATGVTALIALFFQFRKRTKEATDEMKKLSEWTDTIERQGEKISQHSRTEGLINQYERLAKKSQLTAKESQRLSQTMRVLQSRFADVRLELNNNNNTVDSQVKRLRQMSKEQKELAEQTLKATKAAIEQRLTELSLTEQSQTGAYLETSRHKRELEGLDKLNRKQRRDLRKTTKAYNEYGEALNQTSQEINTLQNRLVSIENILNPKTEDGMLGNAVDRISALKEAISDLTNAYKKFQELRKYKFDEDAMADIITLFPNLPKGWEPTFEGLESSLQKMLENYKGDVDATRVIQQALTNIRFDKLKTDLDKQLKKLSDDLKRSETVRNFYRNILDLTGDEKMAATLTMEVYGQTGKEFKERVQDEMFGALESVKNIIGEDFFNEMIGNITIFDMKEIRKQVDKLPEIIRPRFESLLAEEEKTSAEWITNLIKTYEKTKTYEERITDIQKREAKNRKEIETSDKLTPEQKATYTAASREKEAKDIAKVQLEALKDTYTWTKAFEDLEGVSDRTLQNLIDLIDEYIKKNRKGLEPQQLKELTRAKENAKAQLMQRHSAEKLQDALSDLVKAREKQKKLEEEGKESTEDYTQSLDDQKRALKDMGEAIADMQSKFGQVTASLKDINSAFMSDEDAAYYAEQIDNVTKSLEGLGKTAVGIAGIIADPADISSWLKAGTGLADIIVGIANAINAAKVKKANDEIERQERAISDLEYAYSRLDKAIDESFGDARIYNYTQQVENLTQKLVKLEAELAAERSKGNKASKDAINGYLDKIRETEDALADLKKSQADFWVGQELTSASEAFVDSWIAAKKEFGDTAAAIEETMQGMVENLISKAAMSGVVQAVLKPWYDELDKIESWDTSTIARMVKDAYDKIPLINQGLEVAYSSLASAGVDIRRSVGNLTGISRNYATASEESILGLTAATNTQNFYMATISDHVAAIRMKVVGDVTPTVTPASAEGPSYEDQMLVYAGYIPTIEGHLSDILTEFKKVISKGGVNATNAIQVRM